MVIMEKGSYSRRHWHKWTWNKKKVFVNRIEIKKWFPRNIRNPVLKLEEGEKSVYVGFEVYSKVAKNRFSKKKWTKAGTANRRVRIASEYCWNRGFWKKDNQNGKEQSICWRSNLTRFSKQWKGVKSQAKNQIKCTRSVCWWKQVLSVGLNSKNRSLSNSFTYPMLLP